MQKYCAQGIDIGFFLVVHDYTNLPKDKDCDGDDAQIKNRLWSFMK